MTIRDLNFRPNTCLPQISVAEGVAGNFRFTVIDFGRFVAPLNRRYEIMIYDGESDPIGGTEEEINKILSNLSRYRHLKSGRE